MAQQPARDTGGIEARGIATVPFEEQTAAPSSIFAVLAGGNLCLSIFAIGWLPVAFGLGWWSSVTSVVIGTLVGSLLLAPMGAFGPRTGTNTAVSSGAHFGVRGRIVGSLLALASALGFTAIAVWAGGDALVAGAHRLLGTPDSDGVRAVSYALITAVLVLIAIYGFDAVVKAQRIMIPAMGALMALGLVAFGGSFDVGYSGGAYLLGFWPTWTLSVVIAGSTVLGYGPFIGDYSRYISPRRHNDRSIALATGLGAFIGLGAPLLFGAFTAVAFTDDSTSYVQSLVAESPLWYLLPIMVIGLVASAAQGAIGLYGTGLDTSSLIPRLSRLQSTCTIGVVAVALVYLGVFAWDAVDSVSAFVTLLGVVTVPWVLIMMIGLWYRRGYYDRDDIQVYIEGRQGGRYWFTGGVNHRAMLAWIPASVFGLLFSATSIGSGPLADVAGGVDLSFVGGGVAGAVAYLAIRAVFPERAVAAPAAEPLSA
jgi:purine-cytosine permease-like protein